jgi:hypothetical protein
MKKHIPKKKEKKKHDCRVGFLFFFLFFSFELLYFKKVDNKLANGVELEDLACVKLIKNYYYFYSLFFSFLFSSE